MKTLVQLYIRIMSLYGAKNLQISESRSEKPSNFGRRRKEKISWADRVRNEEVLQRVKEERNITHTHKEKL